MTKREDVDAVIHMISDYLLNIPKKVLDATRDLQNGHKTAAKIAPLIQSNGIETMTMTSEEPRHRNVNGSINGTSISLSSPKLTASVDPITKVKLKQICVYPVKSCGAFKVSTKWPLTKRGLQFDREWMIVRHNGVALTQKTDTKLCLITPSINVDDGWLELSFPYMDPVKVPLTSAEEDARITSALCQSKVCGDRIEGIDCGDEVADWLSDALCTNGLRLIRQSQMDKRKFKSRNTMPKLSI